jgi:hypothetical protein
MRIYYQGPDAVVTSELFIRRGPSPDTFAICDLRNVYIAPDQHEGAGALVVSTAATLAAVAVAYGFGGPWSALAATAAATVGLGFGVVRWRHRPRRHELRAVYRGSVVALYASSDARVFNQISRALLRALENMPPPSTWDDIAAA